LPNNSPEASIELIHLSIFSSVYNNENSESICPPEKAVYNTELDQGQAVSVI